MKCLYTTRYFTSIERRASIARRGLQERNRQWKIDLIQKDNVLWDDLYEKLIAPETVAGMAALKPTGSVK